MKQKEFDFIKDAFSQILDDIAGNPDWNDAASAISADLGALERELEGKVVSLDKSLEEAARSYSVVIPYPADTEGLFDYPYNSDEEAAFIAGAEWQAEQSKEKEGE